MAASPKTADSPKAESPKGDADGGWVGVVVDGEGALNAAHIALSPNPVLLLLAAVAVA